MKTVKRPGIFSYGNSMKRRQFLTFLTATASIPTIISACNKNDNNESGAIDLGSGDTGILNYFYALEQFQAAFYAQVVTTPYGDMTDDERSLITDIRNHEIAHKQFLKAALGLIAIPELQLDLSTINFLNRDTVLSTARTFKDLSVSAYNGAAQLLTSTDYLLISAKLVSVEARHAGYIRDLLSYGSFADDTIVAGGLDVVQTPDAVLAAFSPFFISKLDASHLPTN